MLTNIWSSKEGEILSFRGKWVGRLINGRKLWENSKLANERFGLSFFKRQIFKSPRIIQNLFAKWEQFRKPVKKSQKFKMLSECGR